MAATPRKAPKTQSFNPATLGHLREEGSGFPFSVPAAMSARWIRRGAVRLTAGRYGGADVGQNLEVQQMHGGR